jgi:amicyanin
MEPVTAIAEPPRASRQGRVRVAALGVVTMLLLAACGAGASGGGDNPAIASNTPATAAGPATNQTPPTAQVPAAQVPTAQVPTTAVEVDIVNFKFTPATLTIKAGTTVVWINKDSIAHTVNFSAGGVSSSVLNQNNQFTHTFTAAGSFAYICQIHPFMHGSVTVTA